MKKIKLLMPLGIATLATAMMPLVSCGKVDAKHIDNLVNFTVGDQSITILCADSRKFTVNETAKFSFKWGNLKRITSFEPTHWMLSLTNNFKLNSASAGRDDARYAIPKDPKLYLDGTEINDNDYIISNQFIVPQPTSSIWSNIEDDSIVSGEFTIEKIADYVGAEVDDKSCSMQFCIIPLA